MFVRGTTARAVQLIQCTGDAYRTLYIYVLIRIFTATTNFKRLGTYNLNNWANNKI